MKKISMSTEISMLMQLTIRLINEYGIDCKAERIDAQVQVVFTKYYRIRNHGQCALVHTGLK